MNTGEEFGRWLKDRRQALDFTRDDLAGLVDCARVTIAKIESGERRPSRQIAERLADALNISPQDHLAFVAWARGTAPEDLPPTPPQPVDKPLTSDAEGTESAAPPDNLPASLTSLLGREVEVSKVRSLLRRVDARLVTLTGPPGIGKTRLALAVASTLRGDFQGGVWFVPLASITDPALVAPTIAQTLGIKEAPGQSWPSLLTAHLRDKAMLLVLDNFEQLTAAASLVADLLAAAPGLKTLITSREPLHVYGEHEFPVPPLALPDLQALPSIETLSQYASLALFVRRVQAYMPGFDLTPGNAQAVAEICVRLDGLPLAIELAAARCKFFAPVEMLARLKSRLSLLVGGPVDWSSRQRTLRGAISWSYDLLVEDEKTLFRRLGVFVGGMTTDAAEVVCGTGADILQALESLLDKSLLTYREVAGEPRFAMLETLREFALEKLEASGEIEELRRRHATYFMEMAEKSENMLLGVEQAVWLARLDYEHDNMRSALGWSLANGPEYIALRISAALRGFWRMRGHVTEGRAWLVDTLLMSQSRTEERAKAAYSAGVLASVQSDLVAARALDEESLSIYRELGSKYGMARVLLGLGLMHLNQGNTETGTTCFKESLALWEELQDSWGIAAALTNLGMAFTGLDDAEARAYLERSLPVWRVVGDKNNMSLALNNLGVLAVKRGDVREARRLWEENLAVYRELGNKEHVALTVLNLVLVWREEGNLDEARSLVKEALEYYRYVGDRAYLASCLDRAAGIAAVAGQPERAARVYGASDALHDSLGRPRQPHNVNDHKRMTTMIRNSLGETLFVEECARGRNMPLEEVIAYAMGSDGTDFEESRAKV